MLIREEAYHFNIYVYSSGHGNYYVNSEKLLKLQKLLFVTKTKKINQADKKIQELVKSLYVSYSTHIDFQTKKATLVYNGVSNYLLRKYDDVGKDNYFDKKYVGLKKRYNKKGQGHICPINTRIINNHIYRHTYQPHYTCSEENVVTNQQCGSCCNFR